MDVLVCFVFLLIIEPPNIVFWPCILKQSFWATLRVDFGSCFVCTLVGPTVTNDSVWAAVCLCKNEPRSGLGIKVGAGILFAVLEAIYRLRFCCSRVWARIGFFLELEPCS